MDILRILPNDQYQAALAASSPSAINPFATINDLTAPDLQAVMDQGSTASVATIIDICSSTASRFKFEDVNSEKGLIVNDSWTRLYSMDKINPGDGLQFFLSLTTGATFIDSKFDKGIVYGQDYSANFTDRSLVDKEYVDNAIPALQDLQSVLDEGETATISTLLNIESTAGARIAFKDANVETAFIATANFSTQFAKDLTQPTKVIQLQISPTNGAIFSDTLYERGIDYQADYSANYTNRTLVDKEYVDNAIPALQDLQSVMDEGSTGLVATPVSFGYNIPTVKANGVVFTDTVTRIFLSAGSGDTIQLKFDETDGATFLDSKYSRGIDYDADYSANYTNRTLVDKEYVDNAIPVAQNLQSVMDEGSTGTVASFVNITSTSVGTIIGYTDAAVESGMFANSGGLVLYANDVPNAPDSMQLVFNPASSATFTDSIFNKGLEYAGDYSANFTDESLITKRYVDAQVGASDTLAEILANGNTTGANDISINGGQSILFNESFQGQLLSDTLTVAQDWQLPDNSGTIALTSDIPAAQDLQSVLDEGSIGVASGPVSISYQDVDTISFVVMNDNVSNIGIIESGDQLTLQLHKTLGARFIDDINNRGIEYELDYSANFTDRSLVDKEYVDNAAPVDSVNTQTGVVVLDADDISDAATTNKFVTAGDLTNLGNLSGTNSGDEVQATETVSGIAEIATQVETDAGTDDTRFVTPLKLANYPFPTGLVTKAGIVASGSFTGSPKKATVTFATAFADNLYSVVITGEDSRMWTVESKTASGFTISANASAALTGNTFWNATKSGES